MSLAGRVVLVTGASSGIGAEVARQLAAAGARVALAARDEVRLEQLAGECRSAAGTSGGAAFVVRTDVTDEASCRDMVERTVAHYGTLDVLVNNAGLGFSARLRDVTDLSVYETLMRVNYLGSVWSTAHALPHLERSKGLVVAVSSLAGLIGVPQRTAYSATKHAMAGFFDSLRVEMMDTGVEVTVIYPGFVFSELNQHALAANGQPFGDKAYKRKKGETMETDECARQIVRAIDGRQRELVMTPLPRLSRVFRLFAPGLIDRLARKTMRARQ